MKAEARHVSLAKTTRPNVSGVLPRKRLFALLDEASPVVWLTGPPGCGKTTLAASWVGARALPCLWYQLDEGDTDVATFEVHSAAAAVMRAVELHLLGGTRAGDAHGQHDHPGWRLSVAWPPKLARIRASRRRA